ncbi:MAG TPA: TetR/AcrR family transcriptional regulator [Bacilli bacterium]|nr:TetR/AcrR family transcriptional regulator [Bacilli bacterium]
MNGITQPLTDRGRQTFNTICRGAETLFHQKGYHLTTIADIAKKSEVGIGTFYLYFSDKYAIYKHLLFEYSHQIRANIAIAVAGIQTRKEQERVGIKTFIKYVRDNPQAYTIIWQSLQVDKELFVDYYQSFARHYAKGLAEAHQRGEIARSDYITASYALMGVANFVGLQVIMFEQDMSSDEKIEAIVDHLIEVLESGLFKK